MNLNPATILALVVNLYEQLLAAQARVAELEAERNGDGVEQAAVPREKRL